MFDKRFIIRYNQPPFWNSLLAFLFWLLVTKTCILSVFLWIMYRLDRDVRYFHGNSAIYGNVIQKYLLWKK